MQIRTLKPIEIGEEVFVSYTDQLFFKHERQDSLKKQYFFTCQCTECTSEVREQKFREVKCQNSKNCAAIIDSNLIKCPDCGSNVETLDFPDATSCKDIKKLLSKLACLENVYPDTNLKMHNLLLKCEEYLYEKSFKEVLPIELRLLKNFECFFPGHHPIKSLQCFRVAKVFSCQEQLDKSVEYFEKALKLIAITHGTDSDFYSSVLEEYDVDKRDLLFLKENSKKYLQKKK